MKIITLFLLLSTQSIFATEVCPGFKIEAVSSSNQSYSLCFSKHLYDYKEGINNLREGDEVEIKATNNLTGEVKTLHAIYEEIERDTWDGNPTPHFLCKSFEYSYNKYYFSFYSESFKEDLLYESKPYPCSRRTDYFITQYSSKFK